MQAAQEAARQAEQDARVAILQQMIDNAPVLSLAEFKRTYAYRQLRMANPNAYEAVGFFERLYKAVMEGLPNANPGYHSFGTGLSMLYTGWTGYDLYLQLEQGGIENVNPFQFGQFLIGVTALGLQGASSFGFGGTMPNLLIRRAGMAGVVLSSLEVWFTLYKSMNDLRFAPDYIDGNGNPVYSNSNSEDPFGVNYSW